MHCPGPEAPLSSPDPPSVGRPLEGRVLAGRYRVGKLLGTGAMGRVYAAEHIELGRTCAVKVIRERADTGPLEDAVARFRVEALAASRLDHPNVLRVLDYGRDSEGLWYLVTEHLEGEDLVDVLAEGALLPTPRILSIMQQLCSGLAHAHDRGVVHRDVKPENIRLVRGRAEDGSPREEVKLLDFGTAKIERGGIDPDALERVVIGTPAYMSPEQASGDGADRRSDLYACGVVLFEMATGRLPFERPTPVALAVAHVECRPPTPRSIREDVDPELESIILWCLRKKPSERPQTARELRDALARLVSRPEARRARSATLRSAAGEAAPVAAPAAVAPAASQPLWQTVAGRRRSQPALLTLVAAAALGGSAWVLFGSALADPRRAELAPAEEPTETAPEPQSLRDTTELSAPGNLPAPLAEAPPAAREPEPPPPHPWEESAREATLPSPAPIAAPREVADVQAPLSPYVPRARAKRTRPGRSGPDDDSWVYEDRAPHARSTEQAPAAAVTPEPEGAGAAAPASQAPAPAPEPAPRPEAAQPAPEGRGEIL